MSDARAANQAQGSHVVDPMTNQDRPAARTGAQPDRRVLVRRLWATALCALCVHLAVVAVKTVTHPSHSPLAVFRVGELISGRAEPARDRPPFVYEQGFPLEHGRFGTDGQAYLIVAHDPLLRRRDMVRYIDAPSYRYGRILLPALSAATCLGGSACIPYAILGWNLVFAAMVGGVAALLVCERGAHWGWGLVIACSGALVCATDIATTEVCAQACGLWGVWLASRGRLWPAVAAFAAAALGRETYALVPAGFAAAAALEHRWREASAFAAAAVPAVAWMQYVRPRTWLQGVEGGGGVNLGPPFGGMIALVRDFAAHPAITGSTLIALAVAVPLIIAMARHLCALGRDRSGLALSGALFVALGVVVVDAVWARPGGFARGLDFLYPSMILCSLVRGDRFVYVLGASTLLHSLNVVFDHVLVGAPP